MSITGLPQRAEVVEFYDDFIDDRFNIVHELLPLSNRSYAGFGGMAVKFYSAPELLEYGITSKGGDINYSLEYQVDEHGQFRMDYLMVTREAGDRVEMRANRDKADIIINDRLTDRIDQGVFESVMRTLQVGEPLDASPYSLARALFKQCPNSQQKMEIHRENVSFSHEDSEIVTDTIHDMQITTRQPHPSGNIVEVRTDISERLSDATEGVGTDYDLLLTAGRPHVTFQEFIDGKPIEVIRPTRYHVDALQTAVEGLLDEAMMRRFGASRS